MKRAQLHQRINELLDLISINNHRLYLRGSDPERIDTDLIKKYVLELYEQVLALEMASKDVVDEKSVAPKEENREHSARQQKTEKESASFEDDEHALKPLDSPVEPENTFKQSPPEVESPEADLETEKGKSSEGGSEPIEHEVQAEVNKPVESNKAENTLKEKDQDVLLSKTVNEQKAEERQSINEKMMKAGNQKIYEKYHQSSIASIRKSISLMKRYEYQKALFKDNADYYNDALKFFDEAGSSDNALQEFNNLAKQFGWDVKEDPLVDELRTLIERRYLD